MSNVTWNKDGAEDLATSPEMRRKLDQIAFAITAQAVPHSGVDTGMLINSMNHSVVQERGELVGRIGSNMTPGMKPIYYWAYHWGGKAAPDQTQLAKPTGRLKSRGGSKKKAPTHPYVKAMRALGVRYEIERGGFEA